VFRLNPPTKSKKNWTETVLYNFTGKSDGGTPEGGVILDDKGALYGTTTIGGDVSSNGTVFKLTHHRRRDTWIESILYAFTGFSNSVSPLAGLVFESGALYGTTAKGGQSHCGSVFQLRPPPKGQKFWTESDIYSFNCGRDGGNPYSSVVFDETGTVYGITDNGGQYGYGVVFSLAPPAISANWTETVLYSFTGGKDGAHPFGGPLVFDHSGALYGTTSGAPVNSGSVFKLLPHGGGRWTEITLHQFSGGDDGADPTAGLTLCKGRLWGTTALGGKFGLGTAFEVGP
jgi:uncharacterized repeat protein (TIGR03803 family)